MRRTSDALIHSSPQPGRLSELRLPHGFCLLANYLDPEEEVRLFRVLSEELQWQQREILLFGRRIPEPRLSCWYGDAEAVYRYSGLERPPLPWHPALDALRARLCMALGCPFNSVLANQYRDRRDSMGWHSDDEPELGRYPVIASISLGSERQFQIARRRGGDRYSLCLPAGSLLVMSGNSQARYRHALPKIRRPAAPRINLTFRYVLRQHRVT